VFKGTQKKGGVTKKKGSPKWRNALTEIETLTKRISKESPQPGTLYYKYKQDDASKTDKSNKPSKRKVVDTTDKSLIKIRFSDLPISRATINGLQKAKFIKMTEVQRASIPHALSGTDIVACARTGSGKTLCYLISIIECLYKKRWSMMDGLGALILVPTRELAMQAFEVLRSFATLHDISAALVIGGKDLEMEREHIQNMNILIATPGRLLQHMDETFTFDGSSLQMLVIDEVDRILDMGFKQSVD
jgi:ATP-dependent RNA helicase DDX10/DBP4